MKLKFESILIVTYGRSGSTLLQGILNSMEGVLVRGENANMCYNMFQTYRAIQKAKEIGPKKSKVQNPWFGCEFLDEDNFLASIQSFVHTSLIGDIAKSSEIKCVGFKEIRYTPRNIKYGFSDYLDFLKKLLPNVAFIFNTRNIGDTSSSSWWSKENPNLVEKLLAKTEKRFEDYSNDHPENTFRITYEDIISKTNRVEQLFGFLGSTYDQKKIDDILSERYSY